MNRLFTMLLIVVAVLILGLCLYSRLFFNGWFDKKYTREKLIQNFTNHENDFSDLIAYFKSKISRDKRRIISFGLSKGDKFSLIVHPVVIDPVNKVIGGNDLKLGSPDLDSALVILGWTNETIKALKEKLANTNCAWIRTTEIYGGDPIEMYPSQDGWGSYSYHIFNAPLSDSLIKIHGNPIGNSKFGECVSLDYNSAP